jgi:cytochrome c-type biogenesis protein
MNTDYISLAAAFGAGLLSFFSPCVLPLVPVYLGSLAGPEIFQPAARRRFPVFLHALSFVIGFSIVFIILGAGAGLVGLAIDAYLGLMRWINGGLLVAFGLFMLVALKVPWLNYEKRLTPSASTTTGYLRSFLIGAVFPVAWIPCTSAVLSGILSLAATSGTALQGAYLLAIYSLGLGLPFLVVGAAFNAMSPLLKRIQRYTGIIYLVSGLLLIAAGVLILTGRFFWL